MSSFETPPIGLYLSPATPLERCPLTTMSCLVLHPDTVCLWLVATALQPGGCPLQAPCVHPAGSGMGGLPSVMGNGWRLSSGWGGESSLVT